MTAVIKVIYGVYSGSPVSPHPWGSPSASPPRIGALSPWLDPMSADSRVCPLPLTTLPRGHPVGSANVASEKGMQSCHGKEEVARQERGCKDPPNLIRQTLVGCSSARGLRPWELCPSCRKWVEMDQKPHLVLEMVLNSGYFFPFLNVLWSF